MVKPFKEDYGPEFPIYSGYNITTNDDFDFRLYRLFDKTRELPG